jgi:hypothetical protein
MKKNKIKADVKTEEPFEQLVKELLALMEAETTGARQQYDKKKKDRSLPPNEPARYFEYWRGLSRMEALVKARLKGAR